MRSHWVGPEIARHRPRLLKFQMPGKTTNVCPFYCKYLPPGFAWGLERAVPLPVLLRVWSLLPGTSIIWKTARNADLRPTPNPLN